MAYVPPNKLVMRVVPTTMGALSDGRRPGASHWTDNRRPGASHYAIGGAGDEALGWALSDGRRPGASHWADNRRPGASHYAIGGAGDEALGGFWDAIGAAVGGAANYVKGTQTPPIAPMAPVDQGISTTTLLLLGALGVGGFLVYKRMKKNRR